MKFVHEVVDALDALFPPTTPTLRAIREWRWVLFGTGAFLTLELLAQGAWLLVRKWRRRNDA